MFVIRYEHPHGVTMNVRKTEEAAVEKAFEMIQEDRDGTITFPKGLSVDEKREFIAQWWKQTNGTEDVVIDELEDE